VLTDDLVSACFGHPVRLARLDDRWSVRARRATEVPAR
jgi:iron complex transport system ATP-binding protein